MSCVVQKCEQQEAESSCRDVYEHLEAHNDEYIVIDVGGEKILVGEPEHAGIAIVVHGGVLIARAVFLPVLEGGHQASFAGRCIGVPAAESKGKDGVRNIADGVGGEEGGVGCCFLWEGGREELEVGFIGAI